MIRITWNLPQSFDLSYHSFAAVLGMQLHCKHWYHLSTLRVSGQAKITFGENEVPFSNRCAEAGRSEYWTVRSEIIWYDFPKRSAYNAAAFRNRQKNYHLISLNGQYGGNLICLLGRTKFMLPCPCRSLSWEQTSSDFDLFLFLYITTNVLNHQRHSKLGHCRRIYSLCFNGKSFCVLFSMWIPILKF